MYKFLEIESGIDYYIGFCIVCGIDVFLYMYVEIMLFFIFFRVDKVNVVNKENYENWIDLYDMRVR